MSNFGKPSPLEMLVASAVGNAIGVVESERAPQKRRKMMFEDRKRRSDAQLKIYREAHEARQRGMLGGD